MFATATANVADAITFLVKPAERHIDLWTSVAYVSWIVYGLRCHGVPEEYIQHVIDFAIETNSRGGQTADEQNRLIELLRSSVISPFLVH